MNSPRRPPRGEIRLPRRALARFARVKDRGRLTRRQPGLDCLLFGGASGLPLSQRDADRSHDQSGDEWNPSEAEVHYNVALFQALRADSFSREFWLRYPAMKIVVAIAFVLILGSLASALVFLMKDKGKSNRTVTALAMRVGFSITLFVLILIAYKLGWIQPTGIR